LCSSPETLAALQPSIDAATAPINAQLSAAPAQEVAKAEQAVAQLKARIANGAAGEQVRLALPTIPSVDPARPVIAYPDSAYPPPAGKVSAEVQARYEAATKARHEAVDAKNQAELERVKRETAEQARQEAAQQETLNSAKQEAFSRDQQALTGAQDVLAKAQVAAQVPLQLVSATPTKSPFENGYS
jgi:hypothetical protein